MKRRRKYIFGYLLVLAVIALMNTSCSRNFKRANLTESLRYLQSATLNEELSTNYGYSESNPIVLKLSADLNYDQIIKEFIDRLWKNGQGKSTGKMQSFTVIEKLKIPIKDYQNQITKSKIINEFSSNIYAYKIISSAENEIITLFFKLNSKSKKLYKPSGFIYSMLSG